MPDSIKPHFQLTNSLFKKQQRHLSRFAAGLVLASVLTSGLTAMAVEESTAKGGASVLHGGVIQTDQAPSVPTVNKNDIKEIAPGTTLDMVVATEITSGVNVSGDEFFGKISRDYVIDGKVVIPKGTLVHGIVEEMAGPKRAGRNGYITTRFDSLITPDGREIAIEGGNSTKDSAGKAALKVVGRASGYTLGGGLVGAIMVMKYGGMAAVAATNGYALAGGAALGGVAGLTAAMLTKGKSAMIQPGAELRIKLTDSLHLPSVNMPAADACNFAPSGLAVKVKGMRFDKDPFGEPSEITLTLDIDNKTENTFSTFEIALEDEFGSVFYPSPFGDTGMWFGRINPNSHSTNNISFSVDNIRATHTLIFFKRSSHEPVARVALTDAMVTDQKAARKMAKQASLAKEDE